MILFYDTETTGKIKDFSQETDGSSNFPNIVQLGYAAYTPEGKLILEASNIIKPNGWVIEEEAQNIHGITLEYCVENGIGIEMALLPFIALHKWASNTVAHNINFDSKIVRSELIRLNSNYHEQFKAKDSTCTMQTTTNFCQLKKPKGFGYKWPKLEELHTKLFPGEEIESAHSALGDVRTTAKCYFRLKELNII